MTESEKKTPKRRAKKTLTTTVNNIPEDKREK